MYPVYQNQADALIHPFVFFSFISLQIPNIKFFVTLISETVRLLKLTLDTQVDNGWIYRVYHNQAAASYYTPSKM